MGVPSENGCSKGFLNSPAVGINSLSNGRSGKARYFGPFCEATGFTIKLKNAVATSVSGLLFHCSPLAIVRAIALVIVDALNIFDQ